jgi:hypothetical protein
MTQNTRKTKEKEKRPPPFFLLKIEVWTGSE